MLFFYVFVFVVSAFLFVPAVLFVLFFVVLVVLVLVFKLLTPVNSCESPLPSKFLFWQKWFTEDANFLAKIATKK